MPSPAIASLFALLLLVFPVPSQAQKTTRDERLIAETESFLATHPDLKYRLAGVGAYENGLHAEALALFQKAAHHADKPSQSMLGEMHWTGTGTPVDRVLGYVWMDLAAERGYPFMLAKREHYWSNLGDAERAQALAVGGAMLAEYGDAAAMPRMEAMLAKARRNVLAGRAGTGGGSRGVMVATTSGWRSVSGRSFHDRKFWKPELYFEWHEKDWGRSGLGRVEVGELTSVEAAEPTDEPPPVE